MKSISIDSILASVDRSPDELHELHEPDLREAFDDQTGEELKPELVRQA